MWNFGTMHPQGPKKPDTQPKPGAPFLASFARSGAFSPKAEGTPATPWIPNSALPPLHKDSINSIVRKTLLATPEFPRLYADMVLATRPNSHEAKILRPQYQKILEVRSTQAYRSILSVIGILQQCPLVSCHNFQSSSLNPRARGLSSIP
jgi:hypothetical protein